MPKKTVREMNEFERTRHSLSARMFRAVLILATVLSIAAIAFGFYLYTDSVRWEYRTETWHMTKAAATVLENLNTEVKAKEILKVYDHISEEERGDGRGEAYLKRFTSIRNDTYEKIHITLRTLQDENGAIAAYVGAIDPKTDRVIYLIDADMSADYCPPGSYDVLEHEWIQALLYGQKTNRFDRLLGRTIVPAIIVNQSGYGYRCIAGTHLFSTDQYTVMVFMDMDMNRVASASQTFLLQYVLLLLTVAVIAALFMVRHLKKRVVTPINALAAAAAAYSADKNTATQATRHFSDLDIRTGDEIENLALTMKDMEGDLVTYVDNLTRVAAERERMSTELSVAADIQEGMLPNIFPAFPERPEFDVYASMHPAKEVGGDFYDFFLIDEDHLALVIADVSGKGIPAALFMMASKIMISNVSLAEKRSPAKILEIVNNRISGNNPAKMFVTVWLGILQISTGILKAANAGHEYPLLRRGDGSYELLKDRHGFVIGGMDDMTYQEYEVQLQPGDAIFQYTDGVTEATDQHNELFGTERLLDAINETPGVRPEETLAQVKRGIDAFVGEAEQFDDITMLCLLYEGPRAETGQNIGKEDES